MTGESRYSRHLRLTELLDLQSPASGSQNELFFIVSHQTHELWFKVIINQLSLTWTSLTESDLAAASRNIRRGTKVLSLLHSQLDLLQDLTFQDLEPIRKAVGTASGLQSEQYDTIRGFFSDQEDSVVRGGKVETPSIPRALRDQLRLRGLETAEALYEDRRNNTELKQFVEDLLDFDQALWIWGVHHLGLAAREVPDVVGTAGTAGVTFLVNSMSRRVLPEYWKARERIAKRMYQ